MNYELIIMNYFVSLQTIMNYTVNAHGHLIDLSEPKVMGILNVTPDSFYAGSRRQTDDGIIARARQIIAEGGSIIDIGACSTRPGSEPVSEAEEMARLRQALGVIRRELDDAVLSVDTFRPDVARMAVEEYGADIINDVSGGDVGRMATRLRVPYILMSSAPSLSEMMIELAEKIQQLHDLGLNDIMVDPGFGFGKTLEQNYQLMNLLEQLQVLQLPVLVGVSRKSMLFRLLDGTPEQMLNGTTVLHTLALQKGASLLRVHDVREAVECVRIVRQLTK